MIFPMLNDIFNGGQLFMSQPIESDYGHVSLGLNHVTDRRGLPRSHASFSVL